MNARWFGRRRSQGLPIWHRSDISPLALLGLRLITAPRVSETSGTTPGYSWPWRRREIVQPGDAACTCLGMREARDRSVEQPFRAGMSQPSPHARWAIALD
jgi:hypothetical protein